MPISMMKRVSALVCAVGLLGAPAVQGQEVDAEEIVLDNGMTVLLLPRPGDPNVSAGWVAKVGSVYERPGITGVAHLFEHMMFKGTSTIGTLNIEQDLQLIAELDQVKAQMRVEEATLLEAHRLGRIEDPNDPSLRTPEHSSLIERFDALLEEQSELIIKEDFSRLYSGQGASGMNAGTSYDYTIYFVNVPANKLELWFWMESDRLLNPVFREFYSEREVVHEERRLRTDSTPTGKFEEQFDSLFWQSSPYGWPVVGWPSDLEGITREEALSFFGLYYAPNNLTAALVGDFDPVEAKALAERYFGRLTRSERPAPQPRTREVPQLGEKRMTAYAETNPQVSIRYHSVPDGHVDEPPLVVLGQLLNGRTGRLYRSLVEEQEVATGASGGQSGMKFEGMFSLGGTAKDGRTPEEVEQALYVEIERLKTELVEPRELQKVKNQNAAANFRGLRSNYGLMTGLLVREAWRGWETINTDQALYDAVTAEDIRRVANTYFEPENRAVAVYYREESSEPPDPRLAGLDDQERQQVMQVIGMVAEATPEQLGQLASQIEQMGGQAPEENQDMIAALREIVQERLAAGGAGR
jgi:predicted Zn-dependent peptidase